MIELVGDAKPPAGVASPVWIHATRPHPVLERLGAAGVHIGPEAPGPVVRSPAEALAALRTGERVYVDASALREAGPSLVRRINAAVAPPPARSGGGAAQALGWSMMLAGVIIWLVARGPVLLGYDEAFVGLGKAELNAANDRLLPFMEHDRATLAGVMIALGALYAGLAMDGLTRWEWAAVVSSAAIGFVSFLLFVGYGYFDPLHFGLTAGLLPTFFLTLKERPPRALPPPDLHNDRAWKRAQTGQLLLVSAALGVTVGGLGIATIGIGGVFVPSDLEFLRATKAEIEAIDPQLTSLIAHDRAGFGGALAAAGVGLLIVALRGVHRGARRLWWTLAAAGLPGFAATTIVHLEVGYSDPLHLAPVLVAGALYTGALICLYPYLATRRRARPEPLRASGAPSPSGSAGRTR
ncbi:hypothetical protein C8N24_3365 [Solirubrobacter pauli]|uniref:Uncharacterized protein n=1 Tax=Solirubrobacter pauli TaxID=166793 RepID=A0A660LEG6_9ACTN|nr:hypothetical protein [Solirubrobacter pauli]RKQ93497.1 hypothetical protein C8N24_3365 [Solirubrobacter pauli]